MKWAIALGCGHGCMFWNGKVFQNGEEEAVRFHTKELAQHVMRKHFNMDVLEDPEDAEFKRRLYVQAVA